MIEGAVVVVVPMMTMRKVSHIVLTSSKQYAMATNTPWSPNYSSLSDDVDVDSGVRNRKEF